ncbi:MAG: hypothetical protein HRT35_18665 [Algicola sp.]|nr:hypothetical protein [Algicola sp.]
MQKNSLIISTLLAAVLGCSSAYAAKHDIGANTIESANAVQGGGSGWPPADPNIKYVCSHAEAPAGWVMTGIGSFGCPGIARYLKYEPVKHDQLICSNGNSPAVKYYVTDKQLDSYGTCGGSISVTYELWRIMDANKIIWNGGGIDYTIELCDDDPLPSSYVQMNYSHEESAHIDYMITARHTDVCRSGFSYIVRKSKATRIPRIDFAMYIYYVTTMRVCTNQSVPPYVDIVAGSTINDSTCDGAPGDGYGQSLEILVDHYKICSGPYKDTAAKYTCGYGQSTSWTVFPEYY